jgi:hypothetical protein
LHPAQILQALARTAARSLQQNGGESPSSKEAVMTGEAHWLPIAFVALSVLPIALLWVRDRREERKYEVEQRCVRCRTRGNQLARCSLVRDARSHEPIGVRSCSLQPGAVACGKPCLRLFAVPA